LPRAVRRRLESPKTTTISAALSARRVFAC
jgi:hypothetical protein